MNGDYYDPDALYLETTTYTEHDEIDEEDVDLDEVDLVTIVQTDDQAEAEYLAGHLDSQGFLVVIEEDEDEAVIDDVVEIMVPRDDAEAALAAIEPFRGMAKYVVGDELGNIDAGWGECTACKSRDLSFIEDEGFHSKRSVLKDIKSLFTGLAFRRPPRALTCNKCGYEWLEKGNRKEAFSRKGT